MIPDALVFVVLCLCAYRVTRLIVLDEILGDYATKEHPRGTGLRRWLDVVLFREDGEARNPIFDWVGKLLSCIWCTGFWVALALVCVWVRVSPVQLGVDGWVLVFAVAGAQGFLGSRPE